MDEVCINGIDGASGDYLLSPIRVDNLTKAVRGERFEAAHLAELKWRHHQATTAHFGVKEGIDPRNLAEAGWGVIFASDADPAIRKALEPLLDHRKKEVSRNNPSYYKEFVGLDGYRPGESKQQFLARHKVGPGPADPDKIPYYLLIVGDPQTIPFRFQYQLDVQYAVGRLHFDTIDGYSEYARSIVELEQGGSRREQSAVFFGVKNPGDRATKLSTEELVKPLATSLGKSHPSWGIRTYTEEQAHKSDLAQLFLAGKTPSLLFTASHGMGFPNGDPRQLPHQGALLCQDWPGPLVHRGAIPETYYFSADDVPDSADVAGLISFHFACYGAGTPQLDDFAHQTLGQPRAIAPKAFLSHLPQRLLSHPSGGALAVVGHVERAWGCSFVWPGAGRQVTVFEDVFARLMSGHPVGSALEPLNQRYAELSSDLSAELEEISFGKITDNLALAGMWTANNDARSYIILGDPAVRLCSIA